MDREELIVICWLLILGILGGVVFLQTYISNRKLKLKKEKERKSYDSWLERKSLARISIYKFRKMAHLTNPVTFTNGVTVSFVEKESAISDMKSYLSFGIEYEIEGKCYCDIFYYDYGISDIIVDDKYSLEDLKGYNWIIETAYDLTENRIDRLKKEQRMEVTFVDSINNNEFVSKINQ